MDREKNIKGSMDITIELVINYTKMKGEKEGRLHGIK